MSALENEKTQLEIEKLKIEVEKEEVELLEARNRVEAHRKETGFSVINRRVVRIAAAIDEESVGQARSDLYDLSRLYPGESLILDINSPGGTVSAGLELFGVLRELSKEGHKIITRIGGEAASMGGVVAQAGDVRQMRRHSWLHLHEASWGSIGRASEMVESAEHIEKVTRSLCDIYAEKSTMTTDEIYERIHRREWYLSAEDALSVAFIDEIV